MATSKLVLAVEQGNWNSGLKKAMSAMDAFIDNAGGLSQALAKDNNSMTKFIDMMKNMETSAQTPKKAMRELVNAIGELQVKYSNLTDTDKNSQFGKAMLTTIDQLKKKAGDLKDQAADLNEELTHLASDTQFTDGLNMMTGAIGSCASAMVAWGGDGENMKEVIADLAKIQTTVAAVESLTKAFQKQNLVLLKNPYVLAAAAIAAVGMAALECAQHESEAVRFQREFNEAMSKAKESVQDQVTKIDILNERLHDNTLALSERKEALKSIQEIIPEYHGALTKEGELINDNSDALKTYRDNLVAVAQSQAAFDMIVEKQKKILQNNEKIEKAKQEQKTLSGNTQTTAAGGFGYGARGAANTVISAGISSLENENKALKAEIETLKGNVTTSSLGSGKNGKGGGGKSTGGGKNDKPTTYTVEKMNLEDFSSLGMSGPTESMNSLTSSLNYWTKQMGDATTAEAASYIQQMIDECQRKIDAQPLALKLGVSAEAAADFQDQFTQLADQMRSEMQPLEITTGTTTVAKDAKETAQAWQSATAAINSAGSALQSMDDPAAKVEGIVMQAIANVALGFAQASASPATGAAGVFGWIAAATAGVATMVATISQIKSATSGYAEGGIIGGSQYAGDMINATARVNSGEMVINQTDQAKLYSAIHGEGLSFGGGYDIVVRGEDLHIVSKNYRRRTGAKI